MYAVPVFIQVSILFAKLVAPIEWDEASLRDEKPMLPGGGVGVNPAIPPPIVVAHVRKLASRVVSIEAESLF